MHRRQRRAPERTVRGNKKENKTKTKQKKNKTKAARRQRVRRPPTARHGESRAIDSFLFVFGGGRWTAGGVGSTPAVFDATQRQRRDRAGRTDTAETSGATVSRRWHFHFEAGASHNGTGRHGQSRAGKRGCRSGPPDGDFGRR